MNIVYIKKHHPTSLLGHSDFVRNHWDHERNEFFIDRHRDTFEVMANWFLKGGPLVRPDHIPIDIFLNELTFYRPSISTIREFLKIEGLLLSEDEFSKEGGLRTKFWNLFEYPESSLAARIVSLISIVAIVISTTIFCAETLPSFQQPGE